MNLHKSNLRLPCQSILNYIDLPCDIKHVILTFYYNDLGYTGEELQTIHKEKLKNKDVKLRTLVESMSFRSTGCSIGWLKPIHRSGLPYAYGAYLSINHEVQTFTIMYRDKHLITAAQYIRLLTFLKNMESSPYLHYIIKQKLTALNAP